MSQSNEYPKRPVVGVGTVVFGPEGVLLIRRGKEPRIGLWSIPGGSQELGETVYEAGRREVLEETGIDVEVLGLIDVVDTIQRDKENKIRFHYTLVDVAAICSDGCSLPPVAATDALEARWFKLPEIESLGMWSETVRIIQLAAEKFAPHAPLS